LFKLPTTVQKFAQSSEEPTFGADERPNRAPTDILNVRTGPEIALPSPEAPLARQSGLMPPNDLSLEGRVVAVAADRRHHFSKATLDRIVLVEGHGVEGDAHAGAFVRHRYLARRQPRLPNLRQVHLIQAELFTSLSEAGFKVAAGDLGENITTTGLDLERMPLGTLIELGPTAIVELTGLRTPCVLIDRFQAGLKRQLSSAETGPPFKSGVLGVVRARGQVAAGDSAWVRLPSSSFRALPAL
jgi:MOSC domain-containing protein YiiM